MAGSGRYDGADSVSEPLPKFGGRVPFDMVVLSSVEVRRVYHVLTMKTAQARRSEIHACYA